jgi:hypothetical protein
VGTAVRKFRCFAEAEKHDKYGTSSMLHFDALSGAVCIVIAMFVLQKIKAAGHAAPSTS